MEGFKYFLTHAMLHKRRTGVADISDTFRCEIATPSMYTYVFISSH